MSISVRFGIAALATASLFAAPPENKKLAPVLPKLGVKTPGIQIPFESLKSDVQVPVESPAWIALGDSVLAGSKSKNQLVRIDPKAGKALDPIGEVKRPCSGAVAAFGSVWAPSCGALSLVRIDPKTYKITATLDIGAADVVQGIAATADGIWMMTDEKTTLSRIDPIENKVAGELRIPAGCTSVAFGETALWVTCPAENRVLRINPQTNLVEKRIEVSAAPRALAFGENSVWVLCDKDGKIDRIDPKTNKVTKTIELMTPGAGGNLAFGEGSLWVSQSGFPVTRIDPVAEKVMQQFWGEGGGIVSVGNGAVWVANAARGTVSKFDPKRILATLPD